MSIKMGHIGVGQARGSARAGRRSTAGSGEVWAFLRDYMQEHAGQSPSVREIAAGTGGSLVGVHQALGELEQRRLIMRGRFGRSRGIRIVGASYTLPDDDGRAPRNGA